MWSFLAGHSSEELGDLGLVANRMVEAKASTSPQSLITPAGYNMGTTSRDGGFLGLRKCWQGELCPDKSSAHISFVSSYHELRKRKTQLFKTARRPPWSFSVAF